MGQRKCFKNVAHRQWVFTISKVLRKLFYKDRLLLAELARCAAATILELYEDGNHQFALTPTGGRYILIVIQIKEVFHVQNAITETAR